MELGLRPVMWSFKGVVPSHDNPFKFEVTGLPRQAWVCEFSRRWRTVEDVNGKQGQWDGDYESPEAALAAVEWASAG
jgi:hypothetical protein